MVFICKLFQSRLEAGQLQVVWRFQWSYSCQDDCGICYTCAEPTWLKPCFASHVVGNVSNNSFTFPQSSGKCSLLFVQKSDHPCVWNTTRASSSVCMSMRRSWMVEAHSLMLVCWQKGIGPNNSLCNVTFGVISTTEWLIVCHKSDERITAISTRTANQSNWLKNTSTFCNLRLAVTTFTCH